MSDSANLFAQQEANRRRSRWLVVGFIVFFAWLGFGGDYIWYLYTAGSRGYHHVFPWVGLALSALAAGLAWNAWRTGPEKILWSAGARELTTPETPEERQYVNVVEEMAIASGLPRPRIWLVPDADPNAFATGRDAETANIAVTQGLLVACSRDELQAVVAHELGHVKNLDVRLMTLLAALVGAIALVADGVGRSVLYSGGGRSSRSRDDKNDSNPLAIILLVVWILSWILAPIIARALALGVSRKREFLADAMSAQFTRNPLALASALRKIDAADAPTASIKRGSAHLCIVDPAGRKLRDGQGGLFGAFATHPPLSQRIAKLEAMAYQRQGVPAPPVPAM